MIEALGAIKRHLEHHLNTDGIDKIVSQLQKAAWLQSAYLLGQYL